MVVIEKSFPRGGVAPTKTNETKVKDEVIFGTLQKKIKKKPKEDENVIKDVEGEAEENFAPKTAELISYDTVQEGMLLMGVVSTIEELFIGISLPGRMSARVSALEISNSYYKIAKSFVEKSTSLDQYHPLNQMFCLGQIVYCRVEDIQSNEHGAKFLKVSLKPEEIHRDLSHMSIKKGFLFIGAIEEIQEHGYIIESGIKGMRTFLPLDKSKKSNNHYIGQLVYLKVERATHDKAATTTLCKEVTPNNFNMKNHSEPNLDYIMPSTMLQFKITRVLKNGLQGSIMNESVTAYVNEHQLSDALSLPDDYEANSVHKARVLYVMPLTKLVYLSLNLRKNEGEAEGEGEDEEDEKENESSKKGSKKEADKAYQRGSIIQNAKVHHLGTGGIIVILDNKHKGLISYKSVKNPVKGNFDNEDLLTKYAKKTKLTVRVLGHDLMDSLYICTDDPLIVNEKYFSFDDAKPGDFVTGIVESKEEKTGGFYLKLGKLKGFIEKLQQNGKIVEQGKLRCRVMYVSLERKTVYLTNRPEYMNKNCKILKSLKKAKVNRTFMGTIVNTGPAFYLIKFFNNIQGTLSRSMVSNSNYFEGQIMMFRIKEIKNDQIRLALPDNVFRCGEICPATISNKLESGLEIKIQYHDETQNNDDDDDDDDDDQEDKNEANSSSGQEFIGFVPIAHLSDFNDLQMARYESIKEGVAAKVACISKNTFSLRDVHYFEKLTLANWQTVQVGDVLRAYVKNVQEDVIELMLPLDNYDKLVKVHWKMLVLNAYHNANIALEPEQVLYVKILSKETIAKTFTVSAKLIDVWDGSLTETAQYTESYLQEVEEIRKSFAEQKKSIANYEIGQKIKAKFEFVNEKTKDWLYSIEKTDVTALVKESIVKRSSPPKPGTQQECIILWIDYANNLLYVSNKRNDIAHIQQVKEIPENLVDKSGMNAKVLLKLDTINILSMKKSGNPIVFVPMRLHFNDLENSIGINLTEGDFCKIAFIHDKMPIAVPETTWKLWKDKYRKRPAEVKEPAVPAKKIKIINESEEEEKGKPTQNKKETKESKQETKTNKKTPLKKEEKPKQESTSTPTATTDKSEKLKKKKPEQLDQNDAKLVEPKAKKQKKISNDLTTEDENNSEADLGFFEDRTPAVKHSDMSCDDKKPAAKTLIKLPGISDFWSTSISSSFKDSEMASSSSDDDDDDDENLKLDASKKKKMTAAEKFKKSREDEKRLREIEEKYADPKALPETIDQFERLVISEPNNSKNWINFMVHHLQAAEIEKAKAVGQRALKTISFRQPDDLLNIWAALMNLDLRYGNKEDFEGTLKEALTCNDPVKVHLRAVEILTNMKKTEELIEILNLITKKYKANTEMWKAVANAYFQIEMPDKAQQMLHRSLSCLPERDHVSTIVAFANLNHKYGQKDMAQTLFEQVVTSYPKRVDIWCQYADVLIKDDLVDQARGLMERATLEKIPLKKMRTIFKKMLEIEQRFGKPQDVDKVKHKAAEYVKAHLLEKET